MESTHDKTKQQLLNLIGNPRKNTGMYFVKEYYEKNNYWSDWVAVATVTDYCSTRRKEEKGKPFADPPRRFEQFRKDECPCYWEEKHEMAMKYVKFRIPAEEDIMVSKDHGFEMDVMDEKRSECGCM